jgi:hypothetical protein
VLFACFQIYGTCTCTSTSGPGLIFQM